MSNQVEKKEKKLTTEKVVTAINQIAEIITLVHGVLGGVNNIMKNVVENLESSTVSQLDTDATEVVKSASEIRAQEAHDLRVARMKAEDLQKEKDLAVREELTAKEESRRTTEHALRMQVLNAKLRYFGSGKTTADEAEEV